MKRKQFKSAYDNYKGTGQHPLFTLYKSPDETKCIDYIWYSEASVPSLKVTQILDLEEDHITHQGYLPNDTHPSDHLPLMVVFEIA